MYMAGRGNIARGDAGGTLAAATPTIRHESVETKSGRLKPGPTWMRYDAPSDPLHYLLAPTWILMAPCILVAALLMTLFLHELEKRAAAIQEAATTCDVSLVNVTGPVLDTLIEENPYYRTATIPGGMYAGNDEDVTTFGVGATVVTSATVAEDVVYQTVKAVFEKFDDFKKLHPAFGVLDKKGMTMNALSAPLHDGAAKYYREAGLM